MELQFKMLNHSETKASPWQLMESTSSSHDDCVFAHQGRYLDGVCAK